MADIFRNVLQLVLYCLYANCLFCNPQLTKLHVWINVDAMIVSLFMNAEVYVASGELGTRIANPYIGILSGYSLVGRGK
jgi:hypothetical protein